jgi:hypothetical protein
MPLLQTIILSLCICTTSYASELIAGLNYGESRDAVTSKLLKCKLVKTNVPANMFARLGLNGAFITTKELEGLKFTLYFDWTDSAGLKEINYRSEAIAGHAYDGQLKEKWSQAINLLSAIHGRAKNAVEYPKKSELSSENIQFSHEWKTSTGYVYLGTGQLESNYSLNITFSQFILSKK